MILHNKSAGPILATIAVLVLPPKEFYKSLVSLLFSIGNMSRFSINKEEITFPKMDKHRYILVASFNLSSIGPVLLYRLHPTK